jgi:hypothetical protein
VSLFAYDNGSFIVESFRPGPVRVRVSVTGVHQKLTDALSNEAVTADADSGAPLHARTDAQRRDPDAAARTSFTVTIAPHSYRVFRAD